MGATLKYGEFKFAKGGAVCECAKASVKKHEVVMHPGKPPTVASVSVPFQKKAPVRKK